MSDLSLYQILQLVRDEIQKAKIGNVTKITGPKGERGDTGPVGGQGIRGPKGDQGPRGDKGLKGDKGAKGDDGAKGEDGKDGVGIARIEQDIDEAVVMHLTDGSSYVVEMPFLKDGEAPKEVHYKAAGGGGGGTIDLTGYVRRPKDTFDGKWLAYRETTDDRREWSPITTDMIETNGQLMFRDINGRFQPTPEELDELTNQLKVNRFIWDKIQELDLKAGGVAISEDPPDDPDNGMFWFDNSEDVMQLFIWHEESDAWVPVAPPTTLEGRVATGEATQQAIIEQIQESLVEQQQIKNKVAALEGAVGEHSFVFDGVSQNPRDGEFILKDPGNRNTNYLSEGGIIAFSATDREDFPVDWSKINTGDVIRISSVDKQIGELRIVAKAATSAFIYEYLGGELDRLSELPYDCLLMSAFDPAGLATIAYVDAQGDEKYDKAGGSIDGQVKINSNSLASEQRVFSVAYSGDPKFYIYPSGKSISRYVVKPDDESLTVTNKDYVDKAIAEAIANLSTNVPSPAQFSWLYGGSSSSAPPDGKFVLDGNKWKFNLHTHNDIFISWPPIKSWNTSQIVEMSIWKTDGTPNRWKMIKHLEIDNVKWGEGSSSQKWLQFHKKWESNEDTLTSGQEYFVTIGGFF